MRRRPTHIARKARGRRDASAQAAAAILAPLGRSVGAEGQEGERLQHRRETDRRSFKNKNIRICFGVGDVRRGTRD